MFDVTNTSWIKAYVTSGGSGDTIDINITDSSMPPVFSALSPNPDNLDDDKGEFIQVYFPTATDTTGWVINNNEDEITTLDPKTLQGEVYFARDPDVFATEWSLDTDDVYELDTFLTNTGGEPLFLNDSEGNIIDEVAYDDAKTSNGWSIDDSGDSVEAGDVAYRIKSDGEYIDTDSASDWKVEDENDFFGTSLSGTVFEDDGTTPVNDGTVELYEGQTDTSGMPTDTVDLSTTSGTYLFDDVAAGDVTIGVTGIAGFEDNSSTITLSTGQDATQNFTLTAESDTADQVTYNNDGTADGPGNTEGVSFSVTNTGSDDVVITDIAVDSPGVADELFEKNKNNAGASGTGRGSSTQPTTATSKPAMVGTTSTFSEVARCR